MFASTVLPTVGRKTLKLTVVSILNQSLTTAEFEVIVVNNSGVLLAAGGELHRLNMRCSEHGEQIEQTMNKVKQEPLELTVQDLIAEPPKPHVSSGALTSEWRLADQEIFFLDRNLLPQMQTIETGAGLSTVVFALKGTEHTCVVPDAAQANRIRKYCSDRNLPVADVNFVIGKSEFMLPKLKVKDFDFALIDGRHAFPTPFIDWYYIAAALKVGGTVLIDDLHIWTCDLLKQYLLSDAEWEPAYESSRAIAFVKMGDSTLYNSWVEQDFVVSRSRAESMKGKLYYLLELIRRGKFYQLRESSLSYVGRLAKRS